MIVVLFVPLVVIVAIVAAVLHRRHGVVEPARFLRAIALSLAILFAVFAGLFLIGETSQDPGGWFAAGLVMVWLVPMVALVASARWVPVVAEWVLGSLVAVVVAVGLWYAIDPAAWRSFEDDRGPVRAIAVFALSLPLAVLAWRRPLFGGALLLVVGLVLGILALLSTGRGGAGGSSVATSSPAVLIGSLYLAAVWIEQHGAGPPATPQV